jgi:hypothetical protein
MVINSQYFPALFELELFWGTWRQTGLGEVLACSCPPLTRY